MIDTVGLLIALTIQQLRTAPVALRAPGAEPMVEAISLSPEGKETIFWCANLRGKVAECFANQTPIFRGGAIKVADASLAPPMRNIRHFSFRGGAIQWHDGKPSFVIGCHTAALSMVCKEDGDAPPVTVGPTADPFETPVRATQHAVVWADSVNSRVVFRIGDRTIDVCCTGEERAFALTDSLLVYVAPAGRLTELRAAVLAPDLSVQREVVIARDALPPRAVAAAAAGDRIAIVWSNGGVYSATGTIDALHVEKLGDRGALPAIATDGQRFIAAWQDRDSVTIAELGGGRSLVALGAARMLPFIAIDWSPRTGFVTFWRAEGDGLVVDKRPIP